MKDAKDQKEFARETGALSSPAAGDPATPQTESGIDARQGEEAAARTENKKNAPRAQKSRAGVQRLVRVWTAVRDRPSLSLSLHIVSHVSVAAAAVAFFGLLIRAASRSEQRAVLLFVLSLAAFIAASVLRAILNFPRPYEVYPIFGGRAPRALGGKSFPSRHAFSIFLIATLLVPEALWVALVLYGLGVLLSAARVLLGIHFPRDVICGAMLGALLGFLTVVLLSGV